MRSVVSILVLAGLVMTCSSALANPPPPPWNLVYATIVYQGTVYDEDFNVPVTGAHHLFVRIYSQCNGGVLYHEEEFPQTPVVNGFFQVAIGTNMPLEAEILDGRELWVETEFEDTTFERHVIRPVAHALSANNATFASNLVYTVVTDPEWQDINPGQTVTVTHNMYGNPRHYIVLLDGKSTNGRIHQANLGTARSTLTDWVGCEWFGLTSSQIKVERAPDDASTAQTKDWDKFRIRMLMNEPIEYVPPPEGN